MKTFWGTVLFASAILSACTQVAPPLLEKPKLLGAVRVEFGLGAAGLTSSAKPLARLGTQSLTNMGGAIQMQLVNTSTFTTGTRGAGGERWVSATYNIRNAQLTSPNAAYNTANSNVSFLATGSASSVGESGIADMQSYGGTALNTPALAQAFKPTHGMRYKVSSNSAEINPDAEDFQAFEESEVAGFATGGLLPLTYGFVVRRSSANPTDRTLPASPAANQFDGRVTFAMRFPLQATAANDPFTFAMNFLVVTDDQTRVTQSLEQQASNTVPAQTAQLTGAVVNTLPSSTYTTGTIRLINSVRLAKAENNSPVYLVQAPNTIVVSSNADSGAGTLRQALFDIANGGTIDLSGINTQTITLLSPLIFNKNVTITNTASSPSVIVQGGSTAFDTSNVRMIQVQTGKTVVLGNMTLQHGSNVGAPARGGAIFNEGTLTLNNVTLSNNQARGNNGGTGAAGGAAFGGAIYSNGTLTLNSVTLTDNRATGGNGGDGSLGSTVCTPICTPTPGGNGGDGGLAQGGGVFIDTGGSLTINTATFDSNTATGGNGGNGGMGVTRGLAGAGATANGGGGFNLGTTVTVSAITNGTDANANAARAGSNGIGRNTLPTPTAGNPQDNNF
jgi:trimeric autotransporter adhesin